MLFLLFLTLPLFLGLGGGCIETILLRLFPIICLCLFFCDSLAFLAGGWLEGSVGGVVFFQQLFTGSLGSVMSFRGSLEGSL
jgi:hypothetical protein